MTACGYTGATRPAAFGSPGQAWGEFSNFQPLAVPIVAGPWSFPTSEHLYQAAKFGAAPEVQRRIANAPTAREAAGIGRGTGAGIDPRWNASA